MIAVDTNVLVRLLTADDSLQIASVKSLFENEAIWIAKTVLLETAWVLQSRSGLDRVGVDLAFTKLLGLPRVEIEDEPAVANALALTKHGIDLADALHLASRPTGAKFVSFDRAFVKRARRAGAVGISEIPVKSRG